MPRFLCWFPDSGDEEDAQEVLHCKPDWAAEEYADQNHSDNDYPEEIDVCVKDESGEVTRWTVCAEPTFTFTAVEAKV